MAQNETGRGKSGLLLKQFSAHYGSVTCLMTDDNFRMDASDLRVYLRPPFKTIDMYNMASKTRLNCSVDVIGKEVSWHELKPDEIKAHGREVVTAGGTELLQGYKLTKYQIKHIFPDTRYVPSKELPALDFWTTREKVFPQNLDNACCKLTGLPQGYGFPLKMYQYKSRTSQSGKGYWFHYKVLDTTRVTRQNFPDSVFDQPKGFRKVENLMDLMVGNMDMNN